MSSTQILKAMTLILILAVLPACSWFGSVEPREPLTIITQQIPFSVYHPSLPSELVLVDVDWMVITESNMDEQFARLKTLQGGEPVVFALTPQGYENMAYNLQEMRRFLLQLKEIVIYYRDVVPENGPDVWKEQNELLNPRKPQ